MQRLPWHLSKAGFAQGAAQPEPVRIAIVDDSLTVRTAFARILREQSDFALAGCFGTAEQAIDALSGVAVDIVLLDLEMPGMGGLEALPKIQHVTGGARVLVVSSLTASGARHTVAALASGADDTMPKPVSGTFDDTYRLTLIGKVRALGGRGVHEDVLAREGDLPPLNLAPVGGLPSRAVMIGASTGGIHALGLFLRSLPRDFALPIMVTQHLPASFMPAFVRQLEQTAGRKTVLADEGMPVVSNQIVIAPGDGHMIVSRENGTIVTRISRSIANSRHVPSVDPMFSSGAKAYEGHVTGIMLSGMGCDGLDGAREMVRSGGRVYVQSCETCAVWGMPGAVAQAGLARAALSPERLAVAVGQEADSALCATTGKASCS